MSRVDRITIKQEKFIAGVLAGKSLSKAAEDAGYSTRSAHVSAHKILRIPKVAQAIQAGRDAIRAQATYDAKAAVEELDRHIAFALETRQSSSLARLTELKLKVLGLLDQKADTPAGHGFQIQIVGVDYGRPSAPKDVTPSMEDLLG